MGLYEYLIGGKKTGQIEDLKDGNPFRDLKEGETFFVTQFKLNGTRVYAEEIKISSIVKEPTYWVFTGLTKKGEEYDHLVLMGNLDKKLEVWEVRDQRAYYKVFSTFEMDDDKTFFELIKKEIKNSKK